MRISHGRSGRPSRFALRALEVAVGLQERLLGQVLGVVMVADAVVGVAVHVAQMRPVELRELRVELRLGLLGDLLGHSLHPIHRCRCAHSSRARDLARLASSGDRRSRGALTPPSHSHCRRTHAQIRSVTRQRERRRGALDGGEEQRPAGAQRAPCAAGSASRCGRPRCRSRRSARPAHRFPAPGARRRGGDRRAARGARACPRGRPPRSRRVRGSPAQSPSRPDRPRRGPPERRRARSGSTACQRFSNSSRLAM